MLTGLTYIIRIKRQCGRGDLIGECALGNIVMADGLQRSLTIVDKVRGSLAEEAEDPKGYLEIVNTRGSSQRRSTSRSNERTRYFNVMVILITSKRQRGQ